MVKVSSQQNQLNLIISPPDSAAATIQPATTPGSKTRHHSFSAGSLLLKEFKQFTVEKRFITNWSELQKKHLETQQKQLYERKQHVCVKMQKKNTIKTIEASDSDITYEARSMLIKICEKEPAIGRGIIKFMFQKRQPGVDVGGKFHELYIAALAECLAVIALNRFKYLNCFTEKTLGDAENVDVDQCNGRQESVETLFHDEIVGDILKYKNQVIKELKKKKARLPSSPHLGAKSENKEETDNICFSDMYNLTEDSVFQGRSQKVKDLIAGLVEIYIKLFLPVVREDNSLRQPAESIANAEIAAQTANVVAVTPALKR